VGAATEYLRGGRKTGYKTHDKGTGVVSRQVEVTSFNRGNPCCPKKGDGGKTRKKTVSPTTKGKGTQKRSARTKGNGGGGASRNGAREGKGKIVLRTPDRRGGKKNRRREEKKRAKNRRGSHHGSGATAQDHHELWAKVWSL